MDLPDPQKYTNFGNQDGMDYGSAISHPHQFMSNKFNSSYQLSFILLSPEAPIEGFGGS